MKRLMFLVLIVFGLSTLHATSNNVYSNGHPVSSNYNRYYPKGNIDVKDLPKPITKYLDKNYSGYTIIVAKRKGNGNYFVKIRYGKNEYHPYYRSLVFNHEGKVIKG